MSSGFVSGGTIENPTERDDEWRKAQAELEGKRQLKEREGQQEGGKSLYEVLQANKDAKQAAFEEATRLKNQFRALNDDEAEYLDSVLEATRKQEAAVNKETLEQLDIFRKQQEEAERAALEGQNAANPPTEDPQWVASGRKRKKGTEKGLLKGLKLRRTSSAAEGGEDAKKAIDDGNKEKREGVESTRSKKSSVSPAAEKSAPSTLKASSSGKTTTAASPPVQPSKPLALNLGYGSSDEDD